MPSLLRVSNGGKFLFLGSGDGEIGVLTCSNHWKCNQKLDRSVGGNTNRATAFCFIEKKGQSKDKKERLKFLQTKGTVRRLTKRSKKCPFKAYLIARMKKRLKGRSQKEISKGCQVCGKKTDKCCSRCKKALYCSRECQLKDWPGHKKVCKLHSEK